MKHVLRIITAILPVAAVILLVAQVVVTNELASLGKKLGRLDTDLSQQQDVYEDLAMQVASASSLFALRERATALGFREPAHTQIVSILPEVPVALRLTQ